MPCLLFLQPAPGIGGLKGAVMVLLPISPVPACSRVQLVLDAVALHAHGERDVAVSKRAFMEAVAEG